MRYGISKYPGFIEINKNEYEQIKGAMKSLFKLLFLEERLDLVMGNFYEYESELLSIASRMMIYRDKNYFSMSDDRNSIGRRIVNLLSACRLFLDQSAHLLTNLYGKNSSQVAFLEKEKNNQYDNCFGYRVMEAFRNHIQHRGAPIHSVRFSYENIETTGISQLLHTVIPSIKIQRLEDEKEFKNSVLEEMKAVAIKDELDIRPLIREYVESIGKIHETIRRLVQEDVKNWESILDNVIARSRKEFGNLDTISSVSIVIEQSDAIWSERYTLFKDFIERRKALENKNSHFNNLAKCFATNEVRNKNA